MGDVVDDILSFNPLGDYSPRGALPFDPLAATTFGQVHTHELLGIDDPFDPLNIDEALNISPDMKRAVGSVLSLFFPMVAPAAAAAAGFDEGGVHGANLGLTSSVGGAAAGGAVGQALGGGQTANFVGNQLGSAAVNAALQAANAPDAPTPQAAPANVGQTSAPSTVQFGSAPAGFPVSGGTAPKIAPWFVDERKAA